MGLSQWVHWIAYFIVNYLKLLVAVVFLSVLLLVNRLYHLLFTIQPLQPTVYWAYLFSPDNWSYAKNVCEFMFFGVLIAVKRFIFQVLCDGEIQSNRRICPLPSLCFQRGVLCLCRVDVCAIRYEIRFRMWAWKRLFHISQHSNGIHS